jgi:hypothetical protein
LAKRGYWLKEYIVLKKIGLKKNWLKKNWLKKKIGSNRVLAEFLGSLNMSIIFIFGTSSHVRTNIS